MVILTELEMKVVDAITNTDHAGDGYGFAGYLIHEDYDMKIMRGVFASLIKKGVADFQEVDLKIEPDGPPATWGVVDEKYAKEVDKTNVNLEDYNMKEIANIKYCGYTLVNLKQEGD